MTITHAKRPKRLRTKPAKPSKATPAVAIVTAKNPRRWRYEPPEVSEEAAEKARQFVDRMMRPAGEG